MASIMKYLKSIIIFISSIVIIPLIFTIFNLFGISTSKIFTIIVSAILMLIIGFITGRSSTSKGYLNGLLLSIICVLLLVIISLIFRFQININSLIYYVIMIFATVMGSMIGINKKVKKLS